MSENVQGLIALGVVIWLIGTVGFNLVYGTFDDNINTDGRVSIMLAFWPVSLPIVIVIGALVTVYFSFKVPIDALKGK